jgi:hypothetical protein
LESDLACSIAAATVDHVQQFRSGEIALEILNEQRLGGAGQVVLAERRQMRRENNPRCGQQFGSTAPRLEVNVIGVAQRSHAIRFDAPACEC